MASNAVWGIDIGQCALKALRCSADENGNLVADAYDFIEYPKILSQPEANPDELIREALETFLSRNEVKGDSVAMSVSGQAGLARFFKPPPVDAKVLPDIVKYEARQQIPFALEDVIWDYQQMGGVEVDGFTLDAEVGLFAMKREQVFRSLKPFTDAEVEVDIVQLAPLAIYNFVTKDILGEQPPAEEMDPDNPPESIVVLSMGTETTDLVITNGSKLWQRSIPLGGNHFTKQLTKELKLTFAKAEHLKRNAREAEDPKKIFQAMRPIFNDLGTEVQRSITYFQSLDRKAKIGRVVMLGNAVKLPGLRQFLEKSLGQEVIRVEEFRQLSGASVVGAPAFKENVLSFAVCFGLCLQGLDEARLSTNLLPREFITARMIRAKKPWAVAAVAAMLVAFVVNFFFYFNASRLVHADRTSTVYVDADDKPVTAETPGARAKPVKWADTASLVEQLDTSSQNHMQKDTEQLAELEHVRSVGEEVVGNADRKLLWLELLKAVNEVLPEDPSNPKKQILDPEKVPFTDRVELQIEHIESEFYPDLHTWFNAEVARRYQEELDAAGIKKKVVASTDSSADPGAADPGAYDAENADGFLPDGPEEFGAPGPENPEEFDVGGDPEFADEAPPMGSDGESRGPGPHGPGWVIEIKGHHYHNSLASITSGTHGPVYVRNTLLKALREKKVSLPTDPSNPNAPDTTEFTFEELGVGYAIIAEDNKIERDYREPNPKVQSATNTNGNDMEMGMDDFGDDTVSPMPSRTPMPVDSDIPVDFEAPKYEFRVQFCWQEKRLSERLQERAEAALAEKLRRAELAEQAAAAADGEAPTDEADSAAPEGVDAADAGPADAAPADGGAPAAPAPTAPVPAPSAPATEE